MEQALDSGIAAVIMAAGKGTRMKSALPKAAHLLLGKPITRHVIDACKQTGTDDVIVVVGHEADTVRAALGDDVTYALQSEQLGTGHACMQAIPSLRAEVEDVLVVPGDTPLITPDALTDLIRVHRRDGNAATLLTAILEDPSHYGRIIRGCKQEVTRIVEARDADKSVLDIKEINTSVYVFAKDALVENLGRLSSDNAQGEYYLTDVIELLNDKGLRVGAQTASDPNVILGINNRAELAALGAIMRERILNELMLSGVTVVDPTSTYVECDVEIGPDTVIHPFTIIERGTRIGSGCEIGPYARLRGVEIADGSR